MPLHLKSNRTKTPKAIVLIACFERFVMKEFVSLPHSLISLAFLHSDCSYFKNSKDFQTFRDLFYVAIRRT